MLCCLFMLPRRVDRAACRGGHPRDAPARKEGMVRRDRAAARAPMATGLVVVRQQESKKPRQPLPHHTFQKYRRADTAKVTANPRRRLKNLPVAACPRSVPSLE
jgi:hypothetical protein